MNLAFSYPESRPQALPSGSYGYVNLLGEPFLKP